MTDDMCTVEPHITTFTLRRVNPLALRVEDISVRDIAHHLALINRWVGASRVPITVAHHSVFVSLLLEGTGWEMEGLFHDAPEAYLGDVSRWVKRHPAMSVYRMFERQAWETICEALHLRADTPEALTEADALMVRYEALHGLGARCHLFDQPTHPVPTREEIRRVHAAGMWEPWDWQTSELAFLRRYRDLQHRKPAKIVGKNNA